MTDLELWRAVAEALGEEFSESDSGELFTSWEGRPLPRWHERADLALRDVAPMLPEWRIDQWCHEGQHTIELVLDDDDGGRYVGSCFREHYDGTGPGLQRAVARAICMALVESRRVTG